MVRVSRRPGTTVSAPGLNERDVEAALAVLLAPVCMNGVGCRVDLEEAIQLVSETGADLDAANDRTRRLVADPLLQEDVPGHRECARVTPDSDRGRQRG